MNSKRTLIIVMSMCICCSFVAFQLGIFTLSKYRAIHVSLITDSPNYLLTQLLMYSTKQVEKSLSFDVNTTFHILKERNYFSSGFQLLPLLSCANLSKFHTEM